MKITAFPRHAEAQLQRRLAKNPAVVLLGPRQVGKTTLAKKVAHAWPQGAVYLDLERPADRRKLDDADAYLRQQNGKLVVLDEIHRLPSVFEVLRGVIDDARAAGQTTGLFLLLGSAAIELMQQASETLAGRISYLEMAPLNGQEAHAGQCAPEKLWLRGGFPNSLLAASDADSLEWRRDFIRSYLERDVPMFAPRLPAETVGRLWRMLAHQQGSLLNQARLASSLGVSAPAIARYVDLLVDLKLLRRLAPWSANIGKRLVKSPKTYVRDSGLVHALLELQTLDNLLGHPVTGASFEGWVIENVLAAAGEQWRGYFYRTQQGSEIDLLLERGGVPEIAIEIKRSTAPSLEKGFGVACDDLEIAHRYVVYSGNETFPTRYGAQVISLLELMNKLTQTTS